MDSDASFFVSGFFHSLILKAFSGENDDRLQVSGLQKFLKPETCNYALTSHTCDRS